MEMQQNDFSQEMGGMKQSFGSGLNQINHDLNSAFNKEEMPEPGEGEKEIPKEDEGVINPEIPAEGDPTPEEKPIIF